MNLIRNLWFGGGWWDCKFCVRKKTQFSRKCCVRFQENRPFNKNQKKAVVVFASCHREYTQRIYAVYVMHTAQWRCVRYCLFVCFFFCLHFWFFACTLTKCVHSMRRNETKDTEKCRLANHNRKELVWFDDVQQCNAQQNTFGNKLCMFSGFFLGVLISFGQNFIWIYICADAMYKQSNRGH